VGTSKGEVLGSGSAIILLFVEAGPCVKSRGERANIVPMMF